jgi:hypothetical protein
MQTTSGRRSHRLSTSSNAGVRTLVGAAFVLLGVAACSSSSGGSGGTGAGSSGGGSSGPSDAAASTDGNSGSDLFSDPAIPVCEHGFEADTEITGQIDGQALNSSQHATTSAIASDEYISTAAAGVGASGTFWHPLDLTWQGSLVEGQALSLSGGYILLTPDNPQGTYYCVTSGDFGAEALMGDAAVGRLFLFRVTGAQQASIPDGGNMLDVQCTGAAVAASIRGCIYRTSTVL